MQIFAIFFLIIINHWYVAELKQRIWRGWRRLRITSEKQLMIWCVLVSNLLTTLTSPLTISIWLYNCHVSPFGQLKQMYNVVKAHAHCFVGYVEIIETKKLFIVHEVFAWCVIKFGCWVVMCFDICIFAKTNWNLVIIQWIFYKHATRFKVWGILCNFCFVYKSSCANLKSQII